MAHKKVAATPTLRDWGDVDSALRKIHEANNTLAELEAEKNRRIDAVKQEYSQTAMSLQNQIKRLEADTREYVSAHRAEMEGKSRRLTFGAVGFRASSSLVVPTNTEKVADIIAHLKSLHLTNCIKITETLDRDALRRQPTDTILQLGLSIRTKDEFYYDLDHDSMADVTAAQ